MQELGPGLALARPHGSGPDEFWQGCLKEEKEKYGMGPGSIPADISVAGVLELGLGRKWSWASRQLLGGRIPGGGCRSARDPRRADLSSARSGLSAWFSRRSGAGSVVSSSRELGPCRIRWSLSIGEWNRGRVALVGEAVILIIFVEPDHWSFGSARFQVLSRVGELELGEAGFAGAEEVSPKIGEEVQVPNLLEENIGAASPWSLGLDHGLGAQNFIKESRLGRLGALIRRGRACASLVRA
ncbi:unnamed protein product [Prunus armeniaca]|uniref:Uncharacterized protein n=1 Tax=Prunus armeniaca TaxID=36596 RepID=A0A6J5VR04_PRUAR|nr:unnamed protein product [Prunus armeniaca]